VRRHPITRQALAALLLLPVALAWGSEVERASELIDQARAAGVGEAPDEDGDGAPGDLQPADPGGAAEKKEVRAPITEL